MELQKVSKVLVPVKTLKGVKQVKGVIVKHEFPGKMIFAPIGKCKTSIIISHNITDKDYKNETK